VGLQDFVKLIRARWVTAAATAIITLLAAIAYTLLQTQLYQASTRLFVSTTGGASATDSYQGNRLSQERVISYTQLLMGDTLAQRTIDKLSLELTPEDLTENISASAKLGTVLIDVDVLDPSPVRARDIANALSDEFVIMARELETPRPGVAPDARVVVEQRASIPDKPVIPKTARNIALGVVLGMMLGVGLAFLRDLLDNTVKSQETLEKITGTGAVGYIPFDKNLQASPALSFDVDNSVTAEAYRKLRTNLQFLAVDDPPRVIVVTSASPSEGKSTTAINVALSLAEAEHSVVLIDGDLRRPRLAKALELVGSVGLSTALSGAAPIDEVLQQTKFPRLTFLGSGQIPPNPSELLGSLAAGKLLGELRTEFDYVIIDSSPLLAVTDAAILAKHADGVLIVARAGKTKREQLQHAVGMLNDVGATLLGAVLSMLPARGAGSYSYGYYYYGRKYGDEAAPQPEGTQIPLTDAEESRPNIATDPNHSASPARSPDSLS